MVKYNNDQEKRRVDLHDCHRTVPGLRQFGYYNYKRADAPLLAHEHGDCMEICFLARGSQCYQVGGEVYDLRGGDVYIVFPGEEHDTLGRPQERGILFWMCIQTRRPPKHFLGLQQKPGRELAAELNQLPRRIFPAPTGTKPLLEELLACLCNEGLLKQQRASMLLLRYVLSLVDASHANAAIEPSQVIQDSVGYIQRNVQELLRVSELAEQADLSISQFKLRFRREVGLSPYEFVLRKKIEAAAHDLADSSDSITEIALRYGFPSSQHFSTMFKRFTGKRPSDCR